jgi:ATP-dependent exoDNAse (exonuclease V) beta subunit
VKSIPESILRPSNSLRFEEEEHRYTATWSDDPLVSVTTLIHQYSKPFDAMYHSERIALRDGVDAQELRDKWKLNADQAADKGTFVHAAIEDVCNDMQKGYIKIPTDGRHPSMIQAVAKFFANNVSIASGWVLPEHRVWWPEYWLAGTIDLVASRFRGVPALIDWKTNKTMEVEGYNNMLPPFQRGKLKLPDANLYHYFLQLNLYRRIMMEHYDFEPEVMVVVHLEKGMFTEYEVPVMDAHIDKILATRKEQMYAVTDRDKDA